MSKVACPRTRSNCSSVTMEFSLNYGVHMLTPRPFRTRPEVHVIRDHSDTDLQYIEK